MHRIAALVLVAACSGKDGEFDSTAFEGGTFQMSTTSVSDSCYDGAMSVVLMPENTTTEWQTTTELPSWSDLPSSYNVDLADPFSAIDVTVEDGGEAMMTVSGASMPGVELDPDAMPGCTADLTIDVMVMLDGDDDVSGNASMTASGIVDAQGTCPTTLSDGCDITVDFTGVRK
jgi:hypothetical protein